MTKADISRRSLPTDIMTGIIIALVSIPISMGYAQVAGLPAAYGLYGSVFPILIFGLMSGSREFIFGVDAAPAALVGAFLAGKGIEAGSERAVQVVPMITLFAAVWLLIMRLLHAGKLAGYISTPVMGGFISGISTTIILMQLPKLMGGSSGSGELIELSAHIVKTAKESFNGTSLLLGGASLAVLLVSKRFIPRVPMSLFVMAGGAVLGYSGFTEERSVSMLGEVSWGLPVWSLPHIDVDILTDVLSVSLTIAVVIMAETLLASGSMAEKNGYKLDSDREVLTYSLGNLAAALTGCCPVNGSVSRSSMGAQYGGRSQVMSLTASAAMIVILLFFTGFIRYLPVPVLTAIVISALLGAVEFRLARRLFRQDRKELVIFLAAFLGVLIFGTVYGVLIGVTLSFVSMIIRTSNPKRSFLGVIPGHEGFHSLERNTFSVPVKGAVIYRFSGNLYFANINLFIDDIEQSLTDETRCVIVDSGAICSFDITAADRIGALERSLLAKGIKLYFASHIGSLNDRFRTLGIGYMVEQGHCRRTISDALLDAGFVPPYQLENGDHSGEVLSPGSIDRLEFEWAFGDEAEAEMERFTSILIDQIKQDDPDKEHQLLDVIHARGLWKGMSILDQEGLLVHLSQHIPELAGRLGIEEEKVSAAISRRIKRLEEKHQAEEHGTGPAAR